MEVQGKHYRTVWMKDSSVYMIEQNLLPFEFNIYEARNYRESCHAIKTMITRGAGAIGATAGFAMAQAFIEADGDEAYVKKARKEIEASRPTAGNLFYATEKVFNAGLVSTDNAIDEAQRLAEENIEEARKIGEYGNELIRDGSRIETHCNAGWLGFVDWGSALAPVYFAKRANKNVFVYVDETRPRNQGARLTAWELQNEGVEHAVIADNAGAHFMSKGLVDMMIVGADRIAANGDVANKIGTLEKAIVAKEFGIPFYVAAPLSTFDLNCRTGEEISIEEREEEEVIFQSGINSDGSLSKIRTVNPGSKALNPAFDVTPAKYISGVITSKGLIRARENEINQLFI